MGMLRSQFQGGGRGAVFEESENRGARAASGGEMMRDATLMHLDAVHGDAAVIFVS
jgi:hypothetical protein